ncbi:MAG: glycosyltransferase family A protein [Actinomycetota bacterium]
MTLPFVSVIVPTQGVRLALLTHTLRSLVQQSYPRDSYEIVVVNDGGDERVEAIVVDLAGASHAPTMRYVHKIGGGVNSARNVGIFGAKGDPVVLTDDDVEAPSEWLKALIAGMGRHPEAGCGGGPVLLRLEGKAPRFCDEHSLDIGHVDHGTQECVLDRFLLGANLAIQRVALERAGGFDERVSSGSGADWEWQRRFLANDGSILYIPDAWLWHRRTKAMITVRRLVSDRFVKAFKSVLFTRMGGANLSMRDELRRLRAHIAHAVRARCTSGLIEAGFALGRVLGIALDRVGLHPGIRGAQGLSSSERSRGK